MPSEIKAPFVVFTDLDGEPLEDGYVYIGEAGLNAIANPVSVYLDSDLTIPAAQPIRTLAGYPSHNGSPGRLYISANDYSIFIRDKNSEFVYQSTSANGTVDGFRSVLSGTISAGQTVIRTDKVGGNPSASDLPDDEKVYLKQFAKWTLSGGLSAYISGDYELTIVGAASGVETFTAEQNADDASITLLTESLQFSSTTELGTSTTVSGLVLTPFHRDLLAANGAVVRTNQFTSGTDIGGAKYKIYTVGSSPVASDGVVAFDFGSSDHVAVLQLEHNTIDTTQVGMQDGGSLDAFLTAAVSYAQANEVNRVTISKACTLTGGLTIALGSHDMIISGPWEWSRPRITHTGNNVGITFDGSSSLFVRAIVENFRIVGNTGAGASFSEHSDSWGHKLQNIYISGYEASAAFIVHNNTRWTEDFQMTNIMSRENLQMVRFKRTAANGGTSSFFGFKTRDVWHQYGVANSNAFRMSSTAVGEGLSLYGADIQIGGWFEVGGGHRTFYVGDNNSFTDSKVLFRLDGFGGLTDGSDLWSVFTTSGGRVDIQAVTASQQGGSIDLTLVGTSTLGAVRHFVNQNDKFDIFGASPRCRVRGAKIRWKLDSVTTDRTYTIDYLPAFSTWKATMRVSGPNNEFSEHYTISVNDSDFLARVISQSIPATSVSDTIATNFKLQAIGGGTGGGFSAGNGGKFEWAVLAATEGDTYTAELELEML